MRAPFSTGLACALAAGAGCTIGTWRMHPGASMARVADVCSTRVVCDVDGCYCVGESRVVQPLPVGFDVGVQLGRGTGTVAPTDSAQLSFLAAAGVNYVLPGDRISVGVQATYLNDRQGEPDGKTTDGVTGWGGNVIGQYAVLRPLVLRAGLGAMAASYVLHMGDPGEIDSPAVFAPRGLVGLTWIVARSMRRDLFVDLQATAMHVPGATAGGTALGMDDVTFSAAIGLALQP